MRIGWRGPASASCLALGVQLAHCSSCQQLAGVGGDREADSQLTLWGEPLLAIGS